MAEFGKYRAEAEERWSETAAYKEHAEKTKDYSRDKWNDLAVEMSDIFAEFAACMEKGAGSDSDEALSLVEKLQRHISANYYTCTNEILAGLGRMYVADERFRNNIDEHAYGTAEFVGRAVEVYCEK